MTGAMKWVAPSSVRWLLLLALATLHAVPTAQGRTWTVALDGTGDFEMVSTAIDSAASGDSVLIRPGVYVEDWYEGPAIWIESKTLSLIGDGTPEDITLSGFRLWFIRCDGSVVKNIRFYQNPGPLYCSHGSMVIQKCVFEDNAGDDQCAAVHGQNGVKLEITDCAFLRNNADQSSCDGGALFSEAFTTVTNCFFYRNHAADLGGAIRARNEITISQCLFLQNSAANGAAVASDAQMSMDLCTFWGNQVLGEGGALYLISGIDEVSHCIIAGTVNGYGVVCPGMSINICCDLWDNEMGDYAGGGCDINTWNGNIFSDPLFCDPAGADFGLTEGSPCLPGDHGGYECGQIGKFGLGCGVSATVPISWGQLKSRYRE